jgi:muconolactone delta-isomerase
MRILAIEHEKPGAARHDFGRLAQAEAARVWELYQAGQIRELYFRQDRPQAVLLLECQDAEEAAAILATLPFVHAGLITFEIMPLAPYPGFARLFSTSQTES